MRIVNYLVIQPHPHPLLPWGGVSALGSFLLFVQEQAPLPPGGGDGGGVGYN